MRIKLVALGVLATFLFTSQSVFAAAMVGQTYEGFDYAPGQQVLRTGNLNGGVGWNAVGDPSLPNAANGNWGNAAALPAASGTFNGVVSPGLSYAGAPTYPSSVGNTANLDSLTPNTTNNVSRLIGQTIDSGTLYWSFLIQRNNDTIRTTNTSLFGPANGVSGTPGNTPERVSIGQIGAAGSLAASTNGNIGVLFNNVNNTSLSTHGLVNAASPIAMGTGVTHLIVARIDFNAAGNDTFTMYVDPSDLSAEPVTPYIQSSNFELTSFNSLRFFTGNAATVGTTAAAAVNASYDEARLGTTYASVTTAIVPEPACLGALAIAVLAVRKRYR